MFMSLYFYFRLFSWALSYYINLDICQEMKVHIYFPL